MLVIRKSLHQLRWRNQSLSHGQNQLPSCLIWILESELLSNTDFVLDLSNTIYNSFIRQLSITTYMDKVDCVWSLF